jgi:hypothetical protein
MAVICQAVTTFMPGSGVVLRPISEYRVDYLGGKGYAPPLQLFLDPFLFLFSRAFDHPRFLRLSDCLGTLKHFSPPIKQKCQRDYG